MLSKINLYVNQKEINLKLDNQSPNPASTILIEQVKALAERYFHMFAEKHLEIQYLLWTKALSFEDLENPSSIEADCLEVLLDGNLQDREKVMENNLGHILFSIIQALAIEAQKTQLLTGHFPTEKELGVVDWKIKNTYLESKEQVKDWKSYLNKIS